MPLLPPPLPPASPLHRTSAAAATRHPPTGRRCWMRRPPTVDAVRREGCEVGGALTVAADATAVAVAVWLLVGAAAAGSADGVDVAPVFLFAQAPQQK